MFKVWVDYFHDSGIMVIYTLWSLVVASLKSSSKRLNSTNTDSKQACVLSNAGLQMLLKVKVTDSFRERCHLCNFAVVPAQCVVSKLHKRAYTHTHTHVVLGLDALCYMQSGLPTGTLRSASFIHTDRKNPCGRVLLCWLTLRLWAGSQLIQTVSFCCS